MIHDPSLNDQLHDYLVGEISNHNSSSRLSAS